MSKRWIFGDRDTEKRIQTLEDRIIVLEHQMKLHVPTEDKEFDGGDWCYSFWRRRREQITLSEAFRLLLDYLNLAFWAEKKIVDRPGHDLKKIFIPTIIPLEQAIKKHKESDFDSVTS